MKDMTGCAGIMIARASHGSPWVFAQARAALDGASVPADPCAEERFRICLRHARHAVAFETDADKAMREFRKHLAWYTKGLRDGRRLRTELFEVGTLAEVEGVLEAFLVSTGSDAAAPAEALVQADAA
jgi:tRNA-dihydrouridine synthase